MVANAEITMVVLTYQSVKKVALIPPNIVYITTPKGKRKQAAAVGMPVKDETTAEPPVSNIAVTKILVAKPKRIKTT